MNRGSLVSKVTGYVDDRSSLPSRGRDSFLYHDFITNMVVKLCHVALHKYKLFK
jgi:hypothetical protein